MQLQVSPYSQSLNSLGRARVKRPKEVAVTPVAAEELSKLPNELTDTAKKLVKRAHNIIEDTWVMIRKKEIDMKTPVLNRKILNKEITLSPLYVNGDRNIVLEIKNDKGLQKIVVDKRAKDFSYEKIVKTDYGTATVSTYNTKRSAQNDEKVKLINELLEEYLPKITSSIPKLST